MLYESRVDTRTVDLMVQSPALGGAAPVRVLLPAAWSTAPTRTWPMLYLLHGANDKTDYQSWTFDTGVVKYTRPHAGAHRPAEPRRRRVRQQLLELRVWRWQPVRHLRLEGAAAAAAAWVTRLDPCGDRRGVDRRVRAIALAALHPGQYSAAASYSGTVDTELPLVAQSIEYGPLLELKSPIAMWGDLVLQHRIWDARNPRNLLPALRGVGIFVSSGNGAPGQLDPAGGSTDLLEQLTLPSTQSFVDRAKTLGVPVTADLYGNGLHNWLYWNRELHRSWPLLAAGLAVSP